MALTPAAVAQWYAHAFEPGAAHSVIRHAVPGCHAVNLIVDYAQGGGINLSPRLDPAAKGMGQHLLEFPVPVPPALAARIKGPSR